MASSDDNSLLTTSNILSSSPGKSSDSSLMRAAPAIALSHDAGLRSLGLRTTQREPSGEVLSASDEEERRHRPRSRERRRVPAGKPQTKSDLPAKPKRVHRSASARLPGGAA